jgi:hypothetical protein
MDRNASKEMKHMLSIGKRVAGIGVAAALIAAAGPVTVAGATTVPTATSSMISPVGPFAGAWQAGADAAIGGWNAGADAAVGGWNAGAAALGMPFQFTVHAGGPLGLHTAGIALP